MNPISAQVVEQTWQRLAGLSAREGRELGEKFVTEQPIVTAYLMGVDHDLFNEDERELLFYLGAVVWQIMSQGDKPLPRVTEQMIEEAERANVAVIESLQDAPDEVAYATIGRLVQEYPQPEVLRYVISALSESTQDEGIRQDLLGVMMIDLKTVIDCFNRD
ncbi:MAG: hypothetical protein N2559_07650 [Anaerolineae bacterium]|nr:hypothetical protein [Anaerolineae bacterium]